MIENVVIVCDYGYIEGGAARIAHETAITLCNDGLDVTFFCSVGPVSDNLKNSGVNIVCLNQDDILNEKNRINGVLRGINNKMAKYKFAELLDGLNNKNTIIHIHTWTKGISSSIFKVAEKKKFKVVLTVHDYFLICPNGGLFNYQKSKICHLKPMSLKCIMCNCDARSYPQKLFRVIRQRRQNTNIRHCNNVSYIFISEFSKHEFLKRYDGIPEDKQYFLPNMINFPEKRERVRCEDNDVYLFIGGITEVKGIRVFCEAVTKASVKAIVIGQGLLRDELEKRYPNVEFVGWKSKDEMLPYLQRARCLVFPSIWYEVSPLTPLEVMSYGIPVICSDLNAASDFIENGKNGMLYLGTADSLENKLGLAKDDTLIAGLSKNAFSEFKADMYSATNYISALKKIYLEVLS